MKKCKRGILGYEVYSAIWFVVDSQVNISVILLSLCSEECAITDIVHAHIAVI